MGKRGLKAVIYLTNFWEWSGGMMTYLYWTNGGRYINMNDPAHPWPEFPDMSSEFYGSPPAIAMLNDYIRAVVGRTNSITGRRYADDPAIMRGSSPTNRDRAAGPEAVQRHMPAYLAWIDGTARLIKSIDPNHMVSTGSEGTQGCVESDQCVFDAHSLARDRLRDRAHLAAELELGRSRRTCPAPGPPSSATRTTISRSRSTIARASASRW